MNKGTLSFHRRFQDFRPFRPSRSKLQVSKFRLLILIASLSSMKNFSVSCGNFLHEIGCTCSILILEIAVTREGSRGLGITEGYFLGYSRDVDRGSWLRRLK